MPACAKALAVLPLAAWLPWAAAMAEDDACHGDTCSDVEADSASLLQRAHGQGRSLLRAVSRASTEDNMSAKEVGYVKIATNKKCPTSSQLERFPGPSGKSLDECYAECAKEPECVYFASWPAANQAGSGARKDCRLYKSPCEPMGSLYAGYNNAVYEMQDVSTPGPTSLEITPAPTQADYVKIATNKKCPTSSQLERFPGPSGKSLDECYAECVKEPGCAYFVSWPAANQAGSGARKDCRLYKSPCEPMGSLYAGYNNAVYKMQEDPTIIGAASTPETAIPNLTPAPTEEGPTTTSGATNPETAVTNLTPAPTKEGPTTSGGATSPETAVTNLTPAPTEQGPTTTGGAPTPETAVPNLTPAPTEEGLTTTGGATTPETAVPNLTPAPTKEGPTTTDGVTTREVVSSTAEEAEPTSAPTKVVVSSTSAPIEPPAVTEAPAPAPTSPAHSSSPGKCCYGGCEACNPPDHYCSSKDVCERKQADGGCDSSPVGWQAQWCPL